MKRTRFSESQIIWYFHISNYHPYRKTIRKYVNSDEERYLTTQHGRDQETGLDYRGARYYDTDVARFLSLDPLAKDHSLFSDSVYVADNPVILIDPDGKKIVFTNHASRNRKFLGATYSNCSSAPN